MALIVLEMWYKIQHLSWNSVLVSCLQKTAILGRASPGMRWLPPSPCLKSRLHSVTETWLGAESRGRNTRRWQRNSFSSQIHFLLNLTPIPLCPAPMSSSPMPTIAERHLLPQHPSLHSLCKTDFWSLPPQCCSNYIHGLHCSFSLWHHIFFFFLLSTQYLYLSVPMLTRPWIQYY